jgi:tRNA threonylcarbamoyladenosine modification (KEOPS) complex  Pcc1 subunit
MTSAEPSVAEKPHVYRMRLPLLSESNAQIAAVALSVDEELRPALVTRIVSADGQALVVEVAAVDARALRSSVLGFLDMAGVVVRALAMELNPCT